MASIIAAGTTTTTALSYSADTSGVLQLQTNGGTTAVTIDTNQNVGIGTSSPSFPLQVQKSGDSRIAIVSTSGSDTAVTQYSTNNGSTYWYNYYNGSSFIFQDNASERMRIDSSGNFGLGVTPSAWGSSWGKAIQVGSNYAAFANHSSNTIIGNNWYNNGTNDIYANNGYAVLYQQTGGVHSWYNAASGTAGNAITFTQAMLLDASGNFGLGVTPSGWSGRTAFQFGAAGQLNYSSGISNGGSSGYGNNGYWNGSADKAITTGYSQIVALNDNGSGRVIILTTSGTSSAGASISYTAGPYVAAGGVSWTNSSDERLKNITGEIQNGLSKVCSLRAAEFTWKDDASNKPQVGLIAQDVQAVLPEVISLTTKYNSEDKTEYLGVSYTETIPLLVAAIKELSAQVTTLQTQVTALKG